MMIASWFRANKNHNLILLSEEFERLPTWPFPYGQQKTDKRADDDTRAHVRTPEMW